MSFGIGRAALWRGYVRTAGRAPPIANGSYRFSIQLWRGAAAIRDRQQIEPAHHRPTGRDDGPPSEAPLPMLSCQPPREPIPPHAGTRAAELQPGGLLVAQLLS